MFIVCGEYRRLEQRENVEQVFMCFFRFGFSDSTWTLRINRSVDLTPDLYSRICLPPYQVYILEYSCPLALPDLYLEYSCPPTRPIFYNIPAPLPDLYFRILLPPYQIYILEYSCPPTNSWMLRLGECYQWPSRPLSVKI